MLVKDSILEGLWLGSLHSFHQYVEALSRAHKWVSSGQKLSPQVFGFDEDDEDEEDEDSHWMLQVVDGVGIIRVNGPMTDKDSPFLRFFGVTSYQWIRDAAVTAANRGDVEKILTVYNTPGGSAAGVSETGDLLSRINKEIKPVSAYTGGQMTSGGYWLGSQAETIYASRLADVGSIGVIAIHAELTELFKEEGINVTVFRAGKYKGKGNPYEKLDKIAEDEINHDLNFVYDVFTETVAEGRGLSLNHIVTNAAEGRSFYAQEAIDVGLVDKIISFDDLMSELRVQEETPSPGQGQSQFSQSVGGIPMKRKILSHKQRAAVQSGAPVSSMVSSEAEGAEPTQPAAGDSNSNAAEGQPTAPASPAASPAGQASPPTAGDPPAAGDPPQGAGGQAIETTLEECNYNPSEVAVALGGQIQTLTDQLIESRVQVKNVETRVEQAEAALPGLMEIARNSIERMQIAMGVAEVDLSDLNAESLVRRYHATQKKFQERFPIGGVMEQAQEDRGDERRQNVLDMKISNLSRLKR